jgi:hypothetical protein
MKCKCCDKNEEEVDGLCSGCHYHISSRVVNITNRVEGLYKSISEERKLGIVFDTPAMKDLKEQLKKVIDEYDKLVNDKEMSDE